MKPSRTWTGKWIWDDSLSGRLTENRMVLFRRKFHVDDDTERMLIHISADSRYRLYINGFQVGTGPCKGDRFNHYYETYDVTSYLRPGENVIAASVLHLAPYGEHHVSGPNAIWRSPWGGLIVDAEKFYKSGKGSDGFGTDDAWKAYHDRSYVLAWESWISGNWLGGVERVDGTVHPHGWQSAEFDDSAWGYARIVGETENRWGLLNDWPLEPRPIPHLYEEEKRFAGVVRTSRPERADHEVLLHAGTDSLLIDSNTSYWIEFDAKELTTGYLRLEMSGGGGSRIRIRCAECYETETADGKRVKGVRDRHTDGYKLVGDTDRYVVSGCGLADIGKREVYEPFLFKTFRYVRLEIETADQPLRLHRFDYRETGYPLDVQTSFQCSDVSYHRLWEISIRTLRRCMHETYEDCPYYEQLQYTMDTALQMLFTYQISGDDRLARRAIHDFHSSRLPDGMLQSRYPSIRPQVIPGFSLYWIGMLHDHYMHYADLAFVRMYMPTAEGVIEWFRRHLTEDGLVGTFSKKYWSYVDWVDGWANGIPPARLAGPLTLDNFMLAAASRQYAALCDAVGRGDAAEEYRRFARQLNEAAAAHCWSEEKGLFRDGPSVEQFSQHAQLWAVLSGAVSGEAASSLMRRTMETPGLARVSYSMSFFLFRALSQAEVYEHVFDAWAPWHAMADLNLTTWAESPNGNRSDCHAWGAVPLYDFPAEILGIKPERPGFSVTAVKPRIGHLTFAEGSAMTPRGKIDVRWELANGRFRMMLRSPAEMRFRVILPDGTERLCEAAEGELLQAECDYHQG